MAELKPCPFCGGKANIDGGNGIVKRYFVFCTKCKIRQENRLTREKAVEAWNRRIDPVQANDYEIVLGGFHNG